MRSAGNFSPEWGYLAPAPSFMRTVRVVLVATAVGATAGAAVVLSLVDRPADQGDKTAVAAHPIVTNVQAALATTIPLTNATPAAVTANSVTAPIAVAPQMQAQTPAPAAVVTQSAATSTMQQAATNAPTESEINPAPAPPSASGIAALSESPPASEAVSSDLTDTPMVEPERMSPQKKTKHSTVGPNPVNANAKTKTNPSLGSVLRNLFSAGTSTRGL